MELDEVIIQETKGARISQSSEGQQRVSELILERPDEEVISLLINRSEGSTPWQAVLDYVRALFYGLGSLAKNDESSRAAKLLQSIFVHTVTLVYMQGSSSVDKKILDCVSFLIQEMESFPKALLPAIYEAIISVLEGGEHRQNGVQSDEGSVHHLLELLPRCLDLIGAASSIPVTGEGETQETHITGIDYRARVLARIIGIRWSKKFVTRMASLLRDLSLDMREMEQFVRKLFVHMKDSEPQDLPSLVYQLLLLASKGYKRIVLTGMINFFNRKHAQETTQKGRSSSVHASKLKSSMDAFRQMEGTIVLHINFAVKQDPALGQEFLYLVRTNSWPLTPFLISVLLSLGRIQRFEQPAFDLLRTAAVKCYRDCQQCRESRWAAAILGSASWQTAGRVEESFMRTVQSNAFGWDHIIPSVVRMGFTLIESAGPGRPRVDDLVRPSDRVSDTQELGISLLSAAFEVHEMARDEIIEQCKCRIIGLRPQHSAPILRMIVLLVQNCPQLMLEHSGRLKECLDYFTFLHPSSASSLIEAISPLFQMSRDLQDYTILVLRKAMFGREETARMTAVQGLLNLIVSEKRACVRNSVPARDRFSEASSSQSSSQLDRSFGRPGNLLQDLLGLLRRCLSQQASVREKLYQGLPKLLEVNPDASEAIFDLVWPHFNRYYITKPGKGASLKLDLCVSVNNEAVQITEPLDHLLSCLHQLLVLRLRLGPSSAFSCTDFGFSESQDQPQELGRFSSGESLAIALRSLRKNLDQSSLGEFCRDKTLDHSLDGCEGEKNTELARIVLGVVEVFVDSAVLDLVNQDSELRRVDAEKDLGSYLGLHDSLMQVVTQKQGRSAVKGSEMKGTVKKGPGRPPKAVRGPGKPPEPKDPGTHPASKSGANSASRPTLIDKRKSFLSSASIVYLLNTYSAQPQLKRDGGRRVRPDGEAAPPAQGTSQQEIAQGKETRAAVYALQNCRRHLKSMTTTEALGQTDSFLGTDTSWQLLIQPLLYNLVALRDSVIDAAGCRDTQQDKGKIAKGRKGDTEMGDGFMLLSLKCLEELIRVGSQRSCLAEVIKYMNVDPEDVPEADQGHESDDEFLSPGETKENVFQEAEAKRLHSWLCIQARPLLEGLLFREAYPEAEVFCGIMQTLGCKLPQVLMQKHGTWAHLLCKHQNIRNVAVARSLMSLAICLSPPPDDLILIETFGTDLLKVTGSDVSEPIDHSDVYPMINKVTKAAIGGLLLQKAEIALVDLEWLVSKLKIQSSSEIPQLDRKTPLRPGGSHRTNMEETLHSRMEALISVLATFTNMTLNGVVAEQALRGAMHFYRCLAAATRLLIAPKGFTQPLPSPLFQRVAELTCKKLTASVYNFMSSKQRDLQEGPALGKESVSQIKREGRTVPNLIFYIEESERYLLQLSKLSKVNLLRSAKRSTARDFRITESSGKKRKTASEEEAEPNEEDPNEENAAGGSDAEEEPATGPEGTVPENDVDQQGEEEEKLQEEKAELEEEDDQQGQDKQDFGAQGDDSADGGNRNSRPSRSSSSRSRVILDSDSEDEVVPLDM